MTRATRSELAPRARFGAIDGHAFRASLVVPPIGFHPDEQMNDVVWPRPPHVIKGTIGKGATSVYAVEPDHVVARKCLIRRIADNSKIGSFNHFVDPDFSAAAINNSAMPVTTMGSGPCWRRRR
jgi:hypothetical protein